MFPKHEQDAAHHPAAPGKQQPLLPPPQVLLTAAKTVPGCEPGTKLGKHQHPRKQPGTDLESPGLQIPSSASTPHKKAAPRLSSVVLLCK